VLGGHKSDRPPDDRHPFGHAQERYFWAFIVALLLFSEPCKGLLQNSATLCLAVI